MIAGYGEG
jgi:hypothetical protein